MDKKDFAFDKVNYILLAVGMVVVVIGFLLMATEPASNIVPYVFCILMAGYLIWLIIRFIRFQLEVSRRRPPQFNKKGASEHAT